MPEEQLKAFLEKVKADTSLQGRLKAAADTDAVVSIAKEAGFSISADDLNKAQTEISEEDLEGVAAGIQDSLLRPKACEPSAPAPTWGDGRRFTPDCMVGHYTA